MSIKATQNAQHNFEADGLQQPKTMTGSTSIGQEQKSQTAVSTGSSNLNSSKLEKYSGLRISTEAHRKPMKTGHMFSKNLNVVNAIQLTLEIQTMQHITLFLNGSPKTTYTQTTVVFHLSSSRFLNERHEGNTH